VTRKRHQSLKKITCFVGTCCSNVFYVIFNVFNLSNLEDLVDTFMKNILDGCKNNSFSPHAHTKKKKQKSRSSYGFAIFFQAQLTSSFTKTFQFFFHFVCKSHLISSKKNLTIFKFHLKITCGCRKCKTKWHSIQKVRSRTRSKSIKNSRKRLDYTKNLLF